MTKQKKQKKQLKSLSELIAENYVAEYETLRYERTEIVDSDASAKNVQARMIVRGLYVTVFVSIAIIWGPWTVLWMWGQGSAIKLWSLPPPPVPTIETIRTGLLLTGAMGATYSLIRLLSAARRRASAHGARSADVAASAGSDPSASASNA